MTSRRWIPRSRGGRIRLVTLAFGLLLTNMPLVQLDHSAGNDGATVISVVSIGLLDGILVATSLIRRQLSIFVGPATAVLAILVGIGLESPFGVLSVCVGVIVSQSMYGGLFSEALRVAAFLPVVPATVALSVAPIDDGVMWYSATSLSLIPTILVFAALVHTLKSALESQAQSKRRARFMATLTADLLATTTLPQALPILKAAAAEMCRLTPGLVLVSATSDRTADQPTAAPISSILGATVENPPTEVPAEIIAEVPTGKHEGLRELKGARRRMTAIGLPAKRRWYAHCSDTRMIGPVANIGLFGVPTSWPDRVLGLFGAGSAELITVLGTLSEHRATTFAYLNEKHARMMAANRDDVTGLATRSAFFAGLDHLMDDGRTPSVALILIGLDGLGLLAGEHGTPASTMATSRLARRLTAEVAGRGTIGRFSDHRFAVALPVTDDEGDVAELAEALRRSLGAPIPLDGRSVSLLVGIGIARTGTGTTSWELADRAAAALRSDREAAVEPLVRTA